MYFENKNKLNLVEFKRPNFLALLWYIYACISTYIKWNAKSLVHLFQIIFFIIYKWYIMTIVSFFFLFAENAHNSDCVIIAETIF